MDTKKISNPQLEALYRLRLHPDFQDFLAVLLTAQLEYMDDLRTVTDMPDVYRAQGKCAAIVEVMEMIKEIPSIMDVRRKSGGS